MAGRLDFVIIVSLALLLSVNIMFIWYQMNHIESMNNYIKKDMFLSKVDGLELNGLYVDDSYYCVWTQGKSVKQIFNTECHEEYHDLVFKDYNHFCNRTKA